MKQNKLDEQWLNEIRQTMVDHEEELPTDGWEKIAAAMAATEEVQEEEVKEQPRPAIEKKQAPMVPLWLRRTAAAVVLGGIGVGGIYYFSDAPGSDGPVLTDRVQMEASTPPERIAASDTDSTLQAETTPFSATVKQDIKQRHIEVKPLDETIEEKNASIAENSAIKEPISMPTTEPTSGPASETVKNTETVSEMHKEEQAVLLAMETGSSRRKVIDSSWNMGVRLGGNRTTDSGSSAGDDLSSNPKPIKPTPTDSTSQQAMAQALTRAVTSGQKDIVLNSKNHLSWSAGISVSKRLNERISLESGLVYTYLSSEVEMYLSGLQHQHLHYLGIPLKLNVTLIEGEHWLFYTDAGTMLEHSLFGKRGSTNLHLNDWQWSVNGGLGLQYKLTDHMGLYFEPGVNYYFSNGSDVPSLRTESPFSINLQIGVRFGL